MLPLIRGADRGSRAGRFRQGRLRRLSPCRAADAGGAAESRPEPRGEGPRPQEPAPVPRVREERAGCGLDQVAGAGTVNRHLLQQGSPRGRGGKRSGAGRREHLDAALHLRTARPDHCRAGSDPTRRRSRKCPRGLRSLRAWSYRLTPKSCSTRAGRLKAARSLAMPSTPEGRARLGCQR
jgi:hypothetical protein